MKRQSIDITGPVPHHIVSVTAPMRALFESYSILVEQQNTALLSLLGIDILTAGVTLVSGSSVRITAIET